VLATPNCSTSHARAGARYREYVLTLYDYVASANCYKVRLLLAQLELPFERIAVDIFDGDTLTDEFARLNPFRSTPVLQLPDGRVLIESNAILWFLASGSPFLPDDAFAQAEVCRWLIYEQSDVMPMIGGLRFRLVTGRFAADSDEAARRRAGAHEALGILDRRLESRSFLAGDRYSIADIAVFAYSHVAGEATVDTSAYPSFLRWLDRVRAQPGFVDDLEPYPPNASVRAGRSIYG
jgi:glutathione S-transferase